MIDSTLGKVDFRHPRSLPPCDVCQTRRARLVPFIGAPRHVAVKTCGHFVGNVIDDVLPDQRPPFRAEHRSSSRTSYVLLFRIAIGKPTSLHKSTRLRTYVFDLDQSIRRRSIRHATPPPAPCAAGSAPPAPAPAR